MLAFEPAAPGRPRLRYSFASYVPARQLVSEAGLVAQRWWLDTTELLDSRPTWRAELGPLSEVQQQMVARVSGWRSQFEEQEQRSPRPADRPWLESQWEHFAPPDPDDNGLRELSWWAFLLASPSAGRSSSLEVAAPAVAIPTPASPPTSAPAPPTAPATRAAPARLVPTGPVDEAPPDPAQQRQRGDLLMVLRARIGATSIYSAAGRRMVPLHYP